MTAADVKLALTEIRDLAKDDEHAHAREDDLWRAVLEAIAKGVPNPGELAALALESQTIEFSRWYA